MPDQDDLLSKMTEEQIREARELLESAADLFFGTDSLEARSAAELNLGESVVTVIRRLEEYWDHLEFFDGFPKSFGRSGHFMSPADIKKEDSEIKQVLDLLEKDGWKKEKE